MTEKKNRNKKQSKAKTSSKVSKGNFGYFRSEKRRRLIIFLQYPYSSFLHPGSILRQE